VNNPLWHHIAVVIGESPFATFLVPDWLRATGLQHQDTDAELCSEEISFVVCYHALALPLNISVILAHPVKA